MDDRAVKQRLRWKKQRREALREFGVKLPVASLRDIDEGGVMGRKLGKSLGRSIDRIVASFFLTQEKNPGTL